MFCLDLRPLRLSPCPRELRHSERRVLSVVLAPVYEMARPSRGQFPETNPDAIQGEDPLGHHRVLRGSLDPIGLEFLPSGHAVAQTYVRRHLHEKIPISVPRSPP